MLNRVIRLRDASAYLGMDKNRFNKEVRPFVSEFRIGIQGVGFDRLDLDAWLDDYKQRSERPKGLKGEKLWGGKNRQDSTKGGEFGRLISKCTDSEFAKALEQITLKKQRNS